MNKGQSQSAFTMIELSIVLIIIGLIIGGILVGRDLIKAATLRSQVKQIEELSTSVNTFRVKYNGIPGDLLSTKATELGFFSSTRGPTRPWGDGSGILESGTNGCNAAGLTNCFYAEFLIFFRHLSDSNLIAGTYGVSSFITDDGMPLADADSKDEIGQLIPQAKAGNGAFITVFSYEGTNYFGLSGFNLIMTNGYYGATAADNPLSGADAYNIDNKTDDGQPHTGTVLGVNYAQDISSNLNFWTDVSGIANCATAGTAYTLSNADIPACSLAFRFK